MKTNYDICILGATAFTVGFAAAHRELDVVILEEGMTVAPEFSASLRVSPRPSTLTPAGEELFAEFEKRGAVGDDFWQPAVSPVLAGRLSALGNTDAYFFAGLTGIDSVDGGYRLSFTAYGVGHSFTAKKLIDTTSKQLSAPFTGIRGGCSGRLGYFVSSDGKPIVRSAAIENDIAKTREKIIASETDKIILFASGPEYIFASQGEGILRHSAYFADPVSAYSAGASLDPDTVPVIHAKTPSPIDDGEYDIIVAGLGTAGAIAASVASENGLKVLGVDTLSMQGGSGTAGGVLGYYFGFKGGVYREIDDAAAKIDGFITSSGVNASKKAVALDRATKNIDRRYGTITGAIHDGKKILGIRFTEDGNPHEARAKYVIDCTAESVVSVSAGLETQGGRDSDGRFQPYSSVYFRSDCENLSYGYIDNGRVNQYDPDEFSRAVLSSASCYAHLLSDYSDRKYFGIAPLIGLREGLRPVGEENVGFPDIVEGKHTELPVAFGFSNLDNHGKDPVFENQPYQDFITICGLWGYGMSIPLPMGALIPKDSEGILVAGRAVAVDHDIAMGMRMKDDCQKTGEAAARLAALSISSGVRAREVDPEILRGELFASGCIKEEDKMILEKQRTDEVHQYPYWCANRESLIAGLSCDQPGYFIWSVKELGDTEFLIKLLGSPDKNLRWHAALALSLIDSDGDICGRIEDTLIECARSRDGFVPKTGRKYMNLRSVSAICALGRLAKKRRIADPDKVFSSLAVILDGAGEIAEKLPFEKYDLIIDRKDLRFQYESHAIMAISALRGYSGRLDWRIGNTLRGFFDTLDGRKLEVTLMGTSGFRLDCTDELRKLAGIDG